MEKAARKEKKAAGMARKESNCDDRSQGARLESEREGGDDSHEIRKRDGNPSSDKVASADTEAAEATSIHRHEVQRWRQWKLPVSVCTRCRSRRQCKLPGSVYARNKKKDEDPKSDKNDRRSQEADI